VSILNSFQPKEEDVSNVSGMSAASLLNLLKFSFEQFFQLMVLIVCFTVIPLPEEFELQGFLALRPALR